VRISEHNICFITGRCLYACWGRESN